MGPVGPITVPTGFIPKKRWEAVKLYSFLTHNNQIISG